MSASIHDILRAERIQREMVENEQRLKFILRDRKAPFLNCLVKTFEFVQVKTAGGVDGSFEGYASTFGGPPDRSGDVIERGAFKATLRESGGKVPVLMGHASTVIVGFGVGAEEDSKGLKVWGEFTLDSDAGRNAYQVCAHAARLGHNLGLSIGYGIRENGAYWDDLTKVRRLTALDLYEYSIAAVPANPRASVSSVKGVWYWTC